MHPEERNVRYGTTWSVLAFTYVHALLTKTHLSWFLLVRVSVSGQVRLPASSMISCLRMYDLVIIYIFLYSFLVLFLLLLPIVSGCFAVRQAFVTSCVHVFEKI